MTTNLNIRFATINDIPLILTFIRELAEYENLLSEVKASEDILNETLFSKDSNVKVIIGYINDKPVSFALFFHNFSTFLGKPGIYLEDLYVRPHARGFGIGKKMLAFLARLAIQRNCGRLEWWVLNSNIDAIKFYKKIGAQAMDEWTVYRVAGDKLNQLAES